MKVIFTKPSLQLRQESIKKVIKFTKIGFKHIIILGSKEITFNFRKT